MERLTIMRFNTTEDTSVRDDWYLCRTHCSNNTHGPKLIEEVWKSEEAADAYIACMGCFEGVEVIEKIALKGASITKFARR